MGPGQIGQHKAMADSGCEDCLSLAVHSKEGLHNMSPKDTQMIETSQEDSGHEDSISLESGDSDTTNKVVKVTRERQPLPLYQQVLRQQARQGRQIGRDRSPKTKRPGLNLWDIQQTLNRGDYVEGILHLAPGGSSSSSSSSFGI